MYSSGTCSAHSQSIISCTSAIEGGGGSWQPPSRYSRMMSRAMRRASAFSSSVMKPCTSLITSMWGFSAPRITERSPVMWTHARSRVGMLRSSRAAAMAASSSSKGWPTCGLSA